MDTNSTSVQSVIVYALIALLIIVAIVGGVVVAFGHGGALSFSDYIGKLVELAAALGLTSIGGGIESGLANRKADVTTTNISK